MVMEESDKMIIWKNVKPSFSCRGNPIIVIQRTSFLLSNNNNKSSSHLLCANFMAGPSWALPPGMLPWLPAGPGSMPVWTTFLLAFEGTVFLPLSRLIRTLLLPSASTASLSQVSAVLLADWAMGAVLFCFVSLSLLSLTGVTRPFTESVQLSITTGKINKTKKIDGERVKGAGSSWWLLLASGS